MFCPKCGTNVPDVAKFCPSCGVRIGTSGLDSSDKNSVEVQQSVPDVQVRNSDAALQAFLLKGSATTPSAGSTDDLESDTRNLIGEEPSTVNEVSQVIGSQTAQKRKSWGAPLFFGFVGVVTLVVILIVAFAPEDKDSVEFTDTDEITFTLTPTRAANAATSRTASDAEREAKVINDATWLRSALDQFWTQELQRLYRIKFDPPDNFHYYKGNQPIVCGSQRIPGGTNAMYCMIDNQEFVAFDLEWFKSLLINHPGGATTFLILAHEWSHAVQDTWLENRGPDIWDPPYRQELQADCLAGVFIQFIYQNNLVAEDADDSDAMSKFFDTSGGPWLDPNDHGTSDQRKAAFTDGLTRGLTDECRARY